jgi:large subunit ribosomal protein L9
MKVILQKNVPNLGDAGEIKEVAAGYAMNYLIPRKLVIAATASSRKQLAHQQRLIKLKTDRRMGELKQLQEKVNNLEITIQVKVGMKNKLYGSVTANDIAVQLQELGHPVEKRKVELPQPIRALGKYTVTLRLGPGLLTDITVNVEADESSREELARLEKEEEERQARKAAQEAAEAGAEEGEAGQASAEASEDSSDDEVEHAQDAAIEPGEDFTEGNHPAPVSEDASEDESVTLAEEAAAEPETM